MQIVLLESLAVSPDVLDACVRPLTEAGHTFKAFDRTDDTAQLIEEAKDADILMLANMPLKADVIHACPHLKYINIAFTGVDHVDVAAAKARGITVSNASGYSNQAVAELTLSMMLALLRNVPQVDQRCREGGTKDGLVGSELAGKTVGIIGTGAIGMTVARLCHAFGCKLLAYNGFSHKSDTELIHYVPLKELMAESDIVTLHCPVTDQSRGLINAEALSWMRPSAYLINHARGPIVDSQALADALNTGRIAGAAIDVFEMEPPVPVDHPLLTARNTIVTPHVAFATTESMNLRASIVFDNIQAFLKGTPQNLV